MNGTLTGPGYTVPLPPGFTILNAVPPLGVYWVLPPGSFPPDLPSIVQIRPVQPFELNPLLQNLYGLENPYVAQMNAASLGLANVTGMLPARQTPFPQGVCHIREFDAITVRGLPVRVMVIVMQGIQAAVEILLMMNLYRWAEFAAPCLSFVAQVTLAGTAPAPMQLQAVVDKQRTDQIEYQMVSPGRQPIPLTALPTNVGGTTIIHVDTLIQTGDINGTGIAIGSHTMSKVSS